MPEGTGEVSDAAEAINKVAVFACDFELGLEVAYQDYVRMVSFQRLQRLVKSDIWRVEAQSSAAFAGGRLVLIPSGNRSRHVNILSVYVLTHPRICVTTFSDESQSSFANPASLAASETSSMVPYGIK